VPADSPAYGVVQEVLAQLISGNQDFPGINDYKWTISIINDEQVNASVLPVGCDFVSSNKF